MTRPLDGVTVLALEHAIAAPFCTRQLADQGARVIKVERPGVGDFARAYDTRVAGLASHFVWTNRSKESLSLDLKHPQAQTVLHQLLAQTDVLATPLTQRIARFSHWLMWAILSLAALTFAVGTFVHGKPLVDMFMAAVALAVAMIPEGLVVVLTVTLAIGVSRMARRHAIIRHLPAVETLGSTTVICSDKTGTLTRNEMTVQRLWAGGAGAEVSGVGYAPQGAISRDGQPLPVLPPALHELLRAGLLCNDAVLREDDGGWRIDGDPTEGALIVAALRHWDSDLDVDGHVTIGEGCHGQGRLRATGAVQVGAGAVLARLWAREMVTAVYDPRWLQCTTPHGPVSALAFTLSRKSPQHTGELSEEEYRHIFAGASGRFGTSLDYARLTYEALREMGIHDRHLERLLRLAPKR